MLTDCPPSRPSTSVVDERAFSAKAWRRLLSGQVNVWRIVKIYLQRPLLGLEWTLRDLARRLRIRVSRDLGWDLEEICARGLRIVFVFSRGDPGLDLLRAQAGSAMTRLGDRCRIHIIDSADHTFSRSNARAVLEETLSKELFARHATVARTADPALPLPSSTAT